MARPAYGRYVLLVLTPVVAVSTLIVAVAVWMQPVHHDLTRMGGYLERDFGWNKPQLAFRPPLVPIAVPGQHYDVVVIGDSFSTSKYIAPDAVRVDDGFWTDVFRQKTGLTIGAFHRDKLPALDYLTSEVFQTAPPRLLVFEVVERELDYLPVAGASCLAPAENPAFRLSLAPLDQTPVPRARDTKASFSSVRIDAAIDYLSKQSTRWLTGADMTDVLQLRLSRSDLFSSRQSDQLLIYKQERRKARISPDFEAALGCYFRTLQSKVEANGFTSFVLMVVPDKSTAYAAYIAPFSLPNLVERLSRDPALRLLRLDLAMQDAVARGQQDVYLPDDTHWGWAGKSVAAEALIEHLMPVPSISAEYSGP